MFSMRGFLNFQLEIVYITTLQQVYSHEKFVARSCQLLASQDLDESHRYLLLKLADIANRRALHYGVHLRWLGRSLPLDKDTLTEIFWRWLFIRCGIPCFIKLVDRVQRDDIDRLDSLIGLQKGWR